MTGAVVLKFVLIVCVVELLNGGGFVTTEPFRGTDKAACDQAAAERSYASDAVTVEVTCVAERGPRRG